MLQVTLSEYIRRRAWELSRKNEVFGMGRQVGDVDRMSSSVWKGDNLA